ESLTGKADHNWTQLGLGSLNVLTYEDKLMIVAHASVDGVAGRNPANLAQELQGYDLQRVGLITFKCCNVGRGDFLERFADAAADRNIKVGWLKGYRGTTITKAGGLVQPWEAVEHKNSPGFKAGGARYKIVRGRHAHNVVAPPGSRYEAL